MRRTDPVRPLLAWRLGDPSSRRRVVVLAAMHGDEAGPSRILTDLRDGRRIRGVDLWVVPQYNPDGVVRRTRQNAHRVDLNRNFPDHWRRLGGSYYSGPRVCHGTLTEWFNTSFPGVAVTVEYGRRLSTYQATRSGPAGLLSAVGARR